jgi:hypothetical protein
MKKYRIRYSSMTACYDMGYVYAENKEEAEREARGKASAFSQGEKTLIHATEERG